MNKKDILNALNYARTLSKKRNFAQSVEFTMNFKGIDFKKAENRVDVDVKLPHPTGKKTAAKSLLFVHDKVFAQQAKDKVSKIILDADISKLKKSDVDEIVKDYSVLFAEGPSILTVAKFLGQQLAPKGKMPKPMKASLSDLQLALTTVSNYTKVTNKKGKFMPVVHLMVGKEDSPDEQLVENIMEVYSTVAASLPGKEANVKSVYVKLTMGKPIKVGEKYDSTAPAKPAEKPVHKSAEKQSEKPAAKKDGEAK